MSTPLDRLARDPVHHFRLLFYHAVLWLRRRLPAESEELGFLTAYLSELRRTGLGDPADWDAALAEWEAGATTQLPAVALREAAGLERDDLLALFVVGLVEEDPRFGRAFEVAHGGPDHGRPTLGLLNAWWSGGDARPPVRRLLDQGLLEAVDRAGPRTAWPLAVPGSVWDALRGEPAQRPEPWARLRPRDELPALDDLVLATALDEEIATLVGALSAGAVDAVVLRGPATTGRRTTAGALARALDRGVLELDSAVLEDEARWRRACALATLSRSLPVVVLDLQAGALAHVPAATGLDGPLAVVLGRTGGVGGPGVERAVAFELDLPAQSERELHWQAAVPGLPAPRARDLARRHRMSGGNIRRTAELARARAHLSGQAEPSDEDVLAATQALHGRLLDGLAEPVAPASGWSELSLEERTSAELDLLATRCRHREALRDAVGHGRRAVVGAAGVRVLLAGPSGTGKTLAARALAGEVGLSLYRVDLSTVVDKYLGETEKNLAKLFDHAEQANVALLLDEGDALLAQRTAVQTSNDRYANLETNYLLQRLETFEGILIVTTNAGERLDQAFKRRMDVVIELRAPRPAERLRAWELHLPADHTVAPAELEELAVRCELTGGDIRNAVLHACLLSLHRGEPLDAGALRAAVAREYDKDGRAFPMDLGAEMARA